MAASLPVSAFADNWYLDDGDITVIASESGQMVSRGGLTIGIPDSAPVITQSDSSTPTSQTITTKENATANVTLQNVNIDTSSTGEAAVAITGDGNATIELDGVQSHCTIMQDDYATDAIETTSNSMLQQASKSILDQGNNKPQLGLSLLG